MQPVFISSIFFWGGGDFLPLPKNLQFPPQTAAKLCALNVFFGRDNELQIYHGNFLLMDNKHRQLFVIKQSKGCKFMPKIRLVAGLCLDQLGRAYALPQIPQSQWGQWGGERAYI